MSTLAGMLPIDWMMAIILFWLLLGLAGLLSHNPRFIVQIVFPLGAVAALALALAALAGTGQTQVATAPLGLPNLPFHLRLDALSAFFLLLLGAASVGISVFSSGYFRAMPASKLGLLCLEYHVFLASMATVLLADDAYLFMLAWETMALSSYFLVTTDHEQPEVRQAGFLYLLMAHVGALAILMSFGVMLGAHGDDSFAAMRHVHLTSTSASVAMLLALVGFGAKAGVLPLHAWLPEAHPAAPSPVSALMSGIMLKTAVYGLLRISFDLLGVPQWWWGVLLLTLGLITALFGVIFAAVQVDMKRLLAYSSIENIGIILIGIGLAIIFHTSGKGALAALALTAALYHALNHAFMKGLLFLGTGSVLHATGERHLGRLGGLIHGMPRLALLMLVGVLALAGLPPLNGFVSEWLTLQAFLLSPGLPQPYLNMLVPVAAAALALAAALAGFVMVKFYGVVFLGRSRALAAVPPHDAGAREQLGMAYLALGCVLLGTLPTFVVLGIDPVAAELVGHSLAGNVRSTGWLLLTPMRAERASYGPLVLLLVIGTGVLFTAWMVRRFYHGRLRIASAWDCGFPEQNARMQDTAEGFGQPIRQIFEWFMGVVKHMPSPFDVTPTFHSSVHDRLWDLCYVPVQRASEMLSAQIARLQQGRIHVYLLYSFVTLLVLLAFVQ